MDGISLKEQRAYVCEKLSDEESAMIFRQRCSFSATSDYRFLGEMARRCFLEHKERVMLESHSFYGFMERREEMIRRYSPLVILGTDNAAARFFEKWAGRGADIVGFCGMELGHFYSLPVMTAEQAAKRHVFIVSPTGSMSAHQKDMLSCIPRECIVPAGVFNDNIVINTGGEYFDEDIIRLGPDEVFVDIGAKDMETSIVFGEKCGYQYKHIYAFEPDRRCYEICRESLCFFPEETVDISHVALTDECGSLPFLLNIEPGNSCASGDSSFSVPAGTLDALLEGVDVSFIKIHVEGSELAVLRGAAGIIRRCRPRIAVPVYHRPGDIVEIPYYISQLMPSYRLWLRHYSSGGTETVLYAAE